jgi:hypothetical protein
MRILLFNILHKNSLLLGMAQYLTNFNKYKKTPPVNEGVSVQKM